MRIEPPVPCTLQKKARLVSRHVRIMPPGKLAVKIRRFGGLLTWDGVVPGRRSMTVSCESHGSFHSKWALRRGKNILSCENVVEIRVIGQLLSNTPWRYLSPPFCVERGLGSMPLPDCPHHRFRAVCRVGKWWSQFLTSSTRKRPATQAQSAIRTPSQQH